MSRRGAIIAGQSNDTIPSAPTITSITPGSGYLDVNFTAGADGGRPIIRYEYRTDELAAWTAASGTTSPIRISSLFNGTMYHVRIRAINMEGNGPQSNLISQSPYTVPSAPTISTISIGVRSLSVSGSAGSDNGSAITNYKYSTDSGSTFTAFSPAQTSFPLVISGLADATTYPVVVRAVNAAGDGLVSNTVSQITASAPAKPAPPTITSVGDGTISIAWVAPAANNSTITSYTHQRSSDDGANWTTNASTASTSADVGSLANGTSYKFRVNATNAAGTSEWSEKSLADAPWTTPGAPTSVTATKGDTLVDVSWTAPVGTGGYALSTYRLDYKAGSGAWVGGGSATGTSKQITGLSNGTTYTFRVQASNTRSTTTFGAFGESNTAVPSGVPAQVGTPSSSSGDQHFRIDWTAPSDNYSGITGYRVQRSTDSGATWIDTATTTNLYYDGWADANGTSYIGRVQAYNANGNGAYSAASTARTPTFAAPTVSVADITTLGGVTTDTSTWGKRPIRVTFSPTVCLNYDKTIVDIDVYGSLPSSSYTFTGSGANQTQDQSTFETLFGTANIGTSKSITVTVTTYNTAGHTVSTVVTHTTRADITHYTYPTTTWTTDTIKATGGSMARAYFDWYSSSTESVRSTLVYARISDTSSNTVTSSRNPSLGLSSTASATGTGGGTTTMLALNGGVSWAIGGTTRSETWDHTDQNTGFDTGGSGNKYSIVGGGSITGTWATNQQIDVYLKITYLYRSTNLI